MNLGCSLQVTFSYKSNPIIFLDYPLFILRLLIVKFCNWRGILSFLLDLWWKRVLGVFNIQWKLVSYKPFSYFSQSLFTWENRQTLLDQGDLKHVLRSLTYKRNKSCANTNPWGTPHFTSFKLVFTVGSISIYCLLLGRKFSIQLRL